MNAQDRNFVILTDSAANLSTELAEKYDIEIVPLNYIMNGEERPGFVKGENYDFPAFYKAMRAGAKVTTSCMNVEAAEEAFSSYMAKGLDVLYLSFSSALSATYENAVAAAEKLKGAFPDRKLYVVDTLAASMGQGLIATYAAIERDKGKTIEEVRDYVENIKLKLCHQFTVDDLMFLKRGGRISSSTAILGTVLQIKPILHVDNMGRLIPKGKAIGRKASIKAIYKKYEEKAYDKANQIVYVAHADCEADAQYLLGLIAKDPVQPKEIVLYYIDQVIGAHSGPGTLAIFFLGNDREA